MTEGAQQQPPPLSQPAAPAEEQEQEQEQAQAPPPLPQAPPPLPQAPPPLPLVAGGSSKPAFAPSSSVMPPLPSPQPLSTQQQAALVAYPTYPFGEPRWVVGSGLVAWTTLEL